MTVGLRRPLVDELGEVLGVPERLAIDRRQRRPRRLDVIEAHQISPLALDIAHTTARERLECPAEPPAALPRVFRHTALLAAIARQEHDDAIRLTEPVRP